MSELVHLELREHVAVATLNRPDVLNALSRELLEALHGRILEVRGSGARALVVTGAGRAFAAGADIAEMRDMSPAQAEAFSALGHRTFAALEDLPVPTLAAVNGAALGGGCELACACDWVYATRQARFGQPEVKLGLVPGFGGTSRLPRRVGLAWAKELVLSGEVIDSDTALRIGLVNRVVEEEDVVEAAVERGRAIAERAPLAVTVAKRLLQEASDADVRVAHALEQASFGRVFASHDREEGIEAFLARRPPRFRGD